MSRDSVAVLRYFADQVASLRRELAANGGVAMAPEWHQNEAAGWRARTTLRIAAYEAAIAALTREAAPQTIPSPFDICPKCRDEFAECECAAEAAPQASGGDDELTANDVLTYWLDEQGAHNEAQNVRDGVDLESYEDQLRLIGFVMNFRRLATPDSAPRCPRCNSTVCNAEHCHDSAIQSQQGATGGAVDDVIAGGIAEQRRRAILASPLTALTHPQAAGSAPGEALSMSMFASRADYEAATAAGSAPVGVDGKDGASC